MITFLTSIRHPLNSNNFARVEALFEMSLRSVCNQTDQDFRVVVVCNAVPQIGFRDPRVIYHVVDFPPPSSLQHSRTGMNVLSRDKGSKLMAGILAGLDLKPDYFFIFDADDLVSNRVAAFANARPGMAGWYVDAGYTINYRSSRIQRKHGMVRYCGTTLAPSASELFRLSGASKTLSASADLEKMLSGTAPGFIEHVLGNHVYMVRYFAERGLRMQPFPFRAAAWVLDTGENHTGASYLVDGVPVTPWFCREFGYTQEHASNQARAWEWLKESMQCIGSKLGAEVAKFKGFPRVPASVVN